MIQCWRLMLQNIRQVSLMIYDALVEILRNRVPIGVLKTESLEVQFDSTAEVMRGLRITVAKDPVMNNQMIFNQFADRIRPSLIIDGQKYPLGIYMIYTNDEVLSEHGSVDKYEAYDETMILKMNKFASRQFYAAGTLYQNIIETLLVQNGLSNYVINDETSYALSEDREVKPGVSHMEFINGLLDEMNYEHIYADLSGTIHIQKKVEPKKADIVYSDERDFAIEGNIDYTTDIYGLPNVVVGYTSSPDTSETLRSEMVNDSPMSKISTVSRGYKVVKMLQFSDIASQDVLDEIVKQEAVNSMQATEAVTVRTAPQPEHEFKSMVNLNTKLLNGLFLEKGWTLSINTSSGSMSHDLERKVYV